MLPLGSCLRTVDAAQLTEFIRSPDWSEDNALLVFEHIVSDLRGLVFREEHLTAFVTLEPHQQALRVKAVDSLKRLLSLLNVLDRDNAFHQALKKTCDAPEAATAFDDLRRVYRQCRDTSLEEALQWEDKGSPSRQLFSASKVIEAWSTLQVRLLRLTNIVLNSEEMGLPTVTLLQLSPVDSSSRACSPLTQDELLSILGHVLDGDYLDQSQYDRLVRWYHDDDSRDLLTSHFSHGSTQPAPSTEARPALFLASMFLSESPLLSVSQ